MQLKAAEEGGFVVKFPQVPEAITRGDSRGNALLRAVDALENAWSLYIDAGRDLPKAGKGIARCAHPRWAARTCATPGWHMPQVDRLLDLTHTARLNQAEAALTSLGRSLELKVTQRRGRTRPNRVRYSKSHRERS